MNSAYWLNSAWMWKCRIELAKFRGATKAVAATQAGVLHDILEKNVRSQFGRAHGFATIKSPAEFQQRVPLASYENFAEQIARIAEGERAVLTDEPVNLFEPTSGSIGAVKLIPYTVSLRSQFQRGIDAWLGDLLAAYPAVRQGRAYWSISPALGIQHRSSGGIPIGFDDDTAYLGRIERFAIKRLLAVPAELAKMNDLEQFRYQTLLHLLAAEDLTLISIWSPTFLTALLSQLELRGADFCRALRSARFQSRSSRRAGDLTRIFESSASIADKLRLIWPRLVLISCWADGASARYLDELVARFPNVVVQPKGLLATEGFVSFPLAHRDGAALALRCHFFEFIDDRGDLRLAHELELGNHYQVVITTGGGLYRYRLGDIVEIVGYENQCPFLRFVGRDGVCDSVGEKLNETRVRGALEKTFAEHNLAPRFAMLVPVDAPQRGYRLYLQGRNGELTGAKLAEVRAEIEAELTQNPYYDHAVRIGQLAQLEVFGLSSNGESAWTVYERECLKRGQKLGDIKPMLFHSGPGWAECFEPLTKVRALKQ
jgi:GH3 auxin-responsive promoter